MEEVVIVSAARTPVGSFNGAFASVPAHLLGQAAIRAALDRAKVESGDVTEVILGQVLTAAQGQNPARQASIAAGLPIGTPAWGINMVCGSGLRAVALGAQAIRNGDSRIVVAGGQESMSLSPHAAYLRAGQKMGDLNFIDTMIRDGLWDAFNGYHMGTTAENVAREWQITREDQDRFAVASQNKAEAARKAGRFKDEITPVTVKGRKQDTVVEIDEGPRRDTSLERLAALPGLVGKEGSHTAGNSPGVNDGAGALVVASKEWAAANGKEALAEVVAHAQSANDFAYLATTPATAAKKALEKAGLQPGDIDLWEINEAFASVTLNSIRMLGIDEDRVNVNGGAVALGHPIGASGARILGSLVFELRRRGGGYGCAAICSGGGQGDAVILKV